LVCLVALGNALKLESSSIGRFALTHLGAALLLAVSSGAWGLGLGRLSVQSAIGEAVKAEIEIASLSQEEAGTLKVNIASVEAYRTAGVEYKALLANMQVQLMRSGERNFLLVSSDRVVQEPFVDVILELSWASGRLVRDFSLLFDPPANGLAAVPTALATPVIAAPVSAPETLATMPVPVPSANPPSASAETLPKPAAPTAADYKVKSGDTLYRIAVKTQAPGISLDQMLVGLFRNNPDAFVDSNMNRLKSGAVLQLPTSESIGSLPPAEARQMIHAQSVDFDSYRQRLSEAAPTLKLALSDRQAKGNVQAAPGESRTTAVPDKLTLSAAAAANAEAKLSKDSEKKDSAERKAELTRNVEALKKLAGAANPASASSAVVTSGVAAAPAASAAKPDLLEQMLASRLVLPLTGLLLAALGAIGFMQWRSRKEIAKTQAIFETDGTDADSAALGAEKVVIPDKDERLSLALGQLDASGSADPIDEAAAYLDHARDVQAEEVLKEALRSDPERLALRLKLLEVYAYRHDIKSFEELALQVEPLTPAEDWVKVQELGRQIDADNLLYMPSTGAIEPVSEAVVEAVVSNNSEAIELDLDLGAPADASAMDATQVLMTGVENVLPEIDLDLSVPANLGSDQTNVVDSDLDDMAASSFEPGHPLMFDLSSIDLNLTLPEPKAESQPDSQALDLGAPLELAVTTDSAAATAGIESQAVQEVDPLKARYELALEFLKIGDTEGATALLQEVVAQGNGELREKAAAMLKEPS
jgi:pilus assembly protein FimV